MNWKTLWSQKKAKKDKRELELLGDADNMIRSEKRRNWTLFTPPPPTRQIKIIQERFRVEVGLKELRCQQKLDVRIAKATDPMIKEF